MTWSGSLSIIFTLVFVISLVALATGYFVIKGPSYIKFDANIYNVDPAGRVVYYQLPGATPKPLSLQQFASIRVSPGTVINAGFSSNQLTLTYRVPSTKTTSFYVFQDSIQDNTTAFNLTIINSSSTDMSIWVMDNTTNQSITPIPPDVGIGGRVSIPVYTNEIIKFSPVGTSFSDALFIFVVQSPWVNELYITPNGLTTSTAENA